MTFVLFSEFCLVYLARIFLSSQETFVQCEEFYPMCGILSENKFTKLSKIGFSMECFTADFLQFFTKKRQNFAFG